uniref:Uncharacterized protein n=1 Tax=Arundo donax TaxID=35708 RepID=A0A0A9E2A1_ARUDO
MLCFHRNPHEPLESRLESTQPRRSQAKAPSRARRGAGPRRPCTQPAAAAPIQGPARDSPAAAAAAGLRVIARRNPPRAPPLAARRTGPPRRSHASRDQPARRLGRRPLERIEAGRRPDD